MMILRTWMQVKHVNIISVVECFHLKITNIGVEEMLLWWPMQIGLKLYVVYNDYDLLLVIGTSIVIQML
jgi:hypothetical protein